MPKGKINILCWWPQNYAVDPKLSYHGVTVTPDNRIAGKTLRYMPLQSNAIHVLHATTVTSHTRATCHYKLQWHVTRATCTSDGTSYTYYIPLRWHVTHELHALSVGRHTHAKHVKSNGRLNYHGAIETTRTLKTKTWLCDGDMRLRL